MMPAGLDVCKRRIKKRTGKWSRVRRVYCRRKKKHIVVSVHTKKSGKRGPRVKRKPEGSRVRKQKIKKKKTASTQIRLAHSALAKSKGALTYEKSEGEFLRASFKTWPRGKNDEGMWVIIDSG